MNDSPAFIVEMAILNAVSLLLGIVRVGMGIPVSMVILRIGMVFLSPNR